jgi:transposase
LAKTDVLGGAVLAHFAEAIRPEPRPLPDAASQCLAALAPLNRDSGACRGTRAIWGSRRQVRAACSMADVVSVRHHPVLRAFYTQLTARGKPKKVALIACMHKLLTILHAVLRDRTPWQPTLLAS